MSYMRYREHVGHGKHTHRHYEADAQHREVGRVWPAGARPPSPQGLPRQPRRRAQHEDDTRRNHEDCHDTCEDEHEPHRDHGDDYAGHEDGNEEETAEANTKEETKEEKDTKGGTKDEEAKDEATEEETKDEEADETTKEETKEETKDEATKETTKEEKARDREACRRFPEGLEDMALRWDEALDKILKKNVKDNG